MSGQGAPDFPGDRVAVTQSGLCDEHPPLAEWDAKHLILGQCPRCGARAADGWSCARVLRARRLGGQQTLAVD